MGTNYYWHKSGERECRHCGQRTEGLHIGKSSAGWCFSLHVIPEEGIHDLPDWEELWKTGAIFDESGRAVSPAEMVAIITERKWVGRMPPDTTWLQMNGASLGPNGLARHGYGARPGSGTYDLCEGEFS